ncbi:MAG: DUF2231 domain-containing protein [Chthonomonas sp.]|nr:DUF2231 domain-containing protein [Chthonomonas sp.]
MRVLAALILLVGLVIPAAAIPPFLDSLHKIVMPIKGSDYEAAKCQTCHLGGPPKLNPFGLQIKSKLTKRELNAQVLWAIANDDADKDGARNMAELEAGKLPGDALSTPATGSTSAATPPTEAATSPIPKHGFHPLVVHFPVALFLFGAFLDALGHWRKRPELRIAALWNLGFGAIASIGAVVSGLLARYLNEYTFEGTVLIHLILGVSSSVLMLSVAWWRKGREPVSAGYWAFLATACIVLTVAGHFGSMLVYG